VGARAGEGASHGHRPPRPHNDHVHPHAEHAEDPPPSLDLTVPDSALSPADLSRRRFLRWTGLLGAGVAGVSAAGPLATAAAETAPEASPRSGREPVAGWQWLTGDHHIHTQYSPDGLYRVIDQVRHANAFGLDWVVITDHGSVQHSKIGVERVNPDIKGARRTVKDTLVFQGLEWNIPAAEHATVFVFPGSREVDALKALENAYHSHSNYGDTTMRGDESFATNGFYADPVYSGGPNLTAGDYWPGFYSRTHVGARNFSYRAVMEGLRAGRVWVDHGRLIDSLDVRVEVVGGGQSQTLGGILSVRRDARLRLVITIVAATLPNWAGFVPQLRKLDLIRGAVTGPVSDRDTFQTPGTRVVQTWDTGSMPRVRLAYDLGEVGDGFFVRLRGSDGNKTAVGYLGAAVDAEGPAMDVVGDADPWVDLWFYTNPIWVLPRS